MNEAITAQQKRIEELEIENTRYREALERALNHLLSIGKPYSPAVTWIEKALYPEPEMEEVEEHIWYSPSTNSVFHPSAANKSSDVIEAKLIYCRPKPQKVTKREVISLYAFPGNVLEKKGIVGTAYIEWEEEK